MDQVRLGAAGLGVSRLGLGMMSFGDPSTRSWLLQEDDAVAFAGAAADAGITFFDTADVYSEGASEELTGRALREVFTRREEYVLATKAYFPMGSGPNSQGLSRAHLLDAVDASLRRLGVEHIDLFQVHRFDPETPIAETMQALHDLVRAGKVRYLGASSMRAWRFAKMQRIAALNGWTEFCSMQDHYNLLYREEERETVPMCIDADIAFLPWSPLARGRLARPGDQVAATERGRADQQGKRDYAAANLAIIDAVGEVADARGVSRATIGMAWLLQRPGVTAPLVGATRLSHLAEAIAALDVHLTEQECERLEASYLPLPSDANR